MDLVFLLIKVGEPVILFGVRCLENWYSFFFHDKLKLTSNILKRLMQYHVVSKGWNQGGKEKLNYHSAYIIHQAASNANTHLNHKVFFFLPLFCMIFSLSTDFRDEYDIRKKRWMMVPNNLVGDICAIIVFYNYYNFLWPIMDEEGGALALSSLYLWMSKLWSFIRLFCLLLKRLW